MQIKDRGTRVLFCYGPTYISIFDKKPESWELKLIRILWQGSYLCFYTNILSKFLELFASQELKNNSSNEETHLEINDQTHHKYSDESHNREHTRPKLGILGESTRPWYSGWEGIGKSKRTLLPDWIGNPHSRFEFREIENDFQAKIVW